MSPAYYQRIIKGKDDNSNMEEWVLYKHCPVWCG